MVLGDFCDDFARLAGALKRVVGRAEVKGEPVVLQRGPAGWVLAVGPIRTAAHTDLADALLSMGDLLRGE